jgi:cell division protein FtsL
MEQINKCAELESQIQELREWIKANTRRIEDLEASAFQLLEEEEVLLITVPKKKDMKCA